MGPKLLVSFVVLSSVGQPCLGRKGWNPGYLGVFVDCLWSDTLVSEGKGGTWVTWEFLLIFLWSGSLVLEEKGGSRVTGDSSLAVFGKRYVTGVVAYNVTRMVGVDWSSKSSFCLKSDFLVGRSFDCYCHVVVSISAGVLLGCAMIFRL